MTSGVSLPGLRGKQVFALITLICTIFIVWGLEGAPFLSVLPKDERIRRLILADDVRNRFSGVKVENTVLELGVLCVGKLIQEYGPEKNTTMDYATALKCNCSEV